MIVQLSALEVVHVPAPPLAVTVYPVIGVPPVFEGANHDTVALPPPELPPAAVTPVGWPGGVASVTLAVPEYEPVKPPPVALVPNSAT